MGNEPTLFEPAENATQASRPPMPKTSETAQRHFIGDLQPGMQLSGELFMVAQKDLRLSSNGNLYIHMVFKDRTGEALVRIWQASEEMFNQIPAGGFVRVKARVEEYKGNLQIIVEGFTPVAAEDIDRSDFLPKTPYDQDAMLARVREILTTSLANPDCQALVNAFLSDDALMARFRDAPAAMTMHHAYIGGLLEHTLNLLELGLLVCSRYPDISQDVVITGLFLHDIAKTYELSYDTAFAYSDGGQLVGHIYKAAAWVERYAERVEQERGQPLNPKLLEVLQHVILAHHGTPEFGAVRLPATPEAFVIHYIDNIDAKINMCLTAIADDRDTDASWTNYHKGLSTKIYKWDHTSIQDS